MYHDCTQLLGLKEDLRHLQFSQQVKSLLPNDIHKVTRIELRRLGQGTLVSIFPASEIPSPQRPYTVLGHDGGPASPAIVKSTIDLNTTQAVADWLQFILLLFLLRLRAEGSSDKPSK